MKFLNAATIIAILASTTIAAPVASTDPGSGTSALETYVAPASHAVYQTHELSKRWAAESCSTSHHVFFKSLSIYIGYVYANGVGCNGIFHQLQRFLITDWQCVNAGDGNTRLWFDVPITLDADEDNGLNDVLKSIYPGVERFTC